MADCIVEIDLRTPDDQPATGYLEWVPTRRRDITEGDDEWIELPSKFTARLGSAYDDGTVTHDATPGMAWVSVAPTDSTWCWRVTERVRGGTRRYVAVPDDATADYGDLTDVDPATLDPTVEPVPVWKQYIDDADEALQTQIDAVEAAGPAGGVLSGTYPNPGFANATTMTLVGSGGGAPAFENSWANLGAPYITAGFKRTASGDVHLRGLVGGGVGLSTIFTLPVGYRPAATEFFVVASVFGTAYVTVNAAGLVVVDQYQAGGSNAWVSLSGIVFTP